MDLLDIMDELNNVKNTLYVARMALENSNYFNTNAGYVSSSIGDVAETVERCVEELGRLEKDE